MWLIGKTISSYLLTSSSFPVIKFLQLTFHFQCKETKKDRDDKKKTQQNNENLMSNIINYIQIRKSECEHGLCMVPSNICDKAIRNGTEWSIRRNGALLLQLELHFFVVFVSLIQILCKIKLLSVHNQQWVMCSKNCWQYLSIVYNRALNYKYEVI